MWHEFFSGAMDRDEYSRADFSDPASDQWSHLTISEGHNDSVDSNFIEILSRLDRFGLFSPERVDEL